MNLFELPRNSGIKMSIVSETVVHAMLVYERIYSFLYCFLSRL